MDIRREQAITAFIGVGMTPEEAEETVRDIDRSIAISDVAAQISQKRGVPIRRAYELARQEQQHDPAPEGWSKKDHILEALYRLNSNAGVTPQTLNSALKAMDVKTNLLEITALVWDLQKLECVKFKEAHDSTGSQLTRIRLTPHGRAKIVEKRGTPQHAAVRVNADAYKERGVSTNARRGGTHPAGIDRTSFRNHRKVAQGGPIEVIPGRVTVEQEIIPSIPYELPKPPGNPLNQNQKAPFPVIDEPEVKKAGEVTEKRGEVSEKAAHADYMDLHAYPMLEDLLKRRERKLHAQADAEKMLEAAAMIAEIDPKTSEELTTKAAELEGDPLTNLERDVLRFIDEVRRA